MNIRYYFQHPLRLFIRIGKNNYFKLLSDEHFIKLLWRSKMDYKLNLLHPTTYNEKLQWLKLHDRRPEYVKMVDKFEVKEFVSDRIGSQFIIPTLGQWNNVEDIEWKKLPEQFVLKCTHDSGGIAICKSKETFDTERAKRILKKSLSTNYYWANREWPYKNVVPRIIAEPYLEDNVTKELRDYKFFTFDGRVKAMFIATERGSKEETKFDFFDADFNHLPLTNGHPNAVPTPQKPKNFDLMKELAEKLSEGYTHIRVDFYECNDSVYFGELTLYHWSGMTPFEPKEWDYTFGEWINLPK